MKRNFSMGRKALAGVFVLGIFLWRASSGLSATTNDLAAALQKGLFEEEANHNYAAAIASYQMVVDQFDEQRKFAALALFRLSECQRLLNQTNEAVKGYQRLLSEFKDQTNYTAMGRARLTAIGLEDALTPVAGVSKSRLADLQKMPLEQRAIALQQMTANPVLASLLQKMSDAQVELGEKKIDFGSSHPEVKKTESKIKALESQIEAQTSMALRLMEQSGGSESSAATNGFVRGASESSDQVEADEIARLERLFKDSPDLMEGVDGFGLNVLHQAAQKGQLKVAEFILKKGIDIESRTAKPDATHSSTVTAGSTALHIAAASGRKAMLDLLLDHNANPNATDSREASPLHIAARKGFRTVAESLIARGAKVNATDTARQTALHYAAEAGHKSMAELLFEHGASINLVDRNNASPLFVAIAHKQFGMIDLLLVRKTGVNAPAVPTPELATSMGGGVYPNVPLHPLHLATWLGEEEVVVKLLDAGARPDVTIGDQENWDTSLSIAVKQRRLEIAKSLLKHHANPNLKSTSGLTPLQLAVQMEEAELVDLLLIAGTDTEARDPNGDTPLLVAVSRNTPTIATNLVLHKAFVNTTNTQGFTPLHLAIGHLQKDLITFLVEHGAEVNARHGGGATPLGDLMNRPSAGEIFPPGAKPVKVSDLQAQIAAFLRAHGALEKLANLNSITLRRGGEVAVLLNRGTNDANRFTLFELLGIEYQFLTAGKDDGPPGRRERFDLLALNNPDRAIQLFFPDLKHASIRHPQPSLTNWQEEAVDIDARLLPDNCQDMPLKWGDEVEIPETDHPLSERWRGFNQKQIDAFKQCLHRTVFVVVKGHTNTVNVGPVVDSANYVSTRQPVYIGPVIRRSNLLLSSSDTSRVHVLRPSSAEQAAREWTLNLSTSPDLWLRDGDVILVPEKQ